MIYSCAFRPIARGATIREEAGAARIFTDLPPRRPPDMPVRKRLRVIGGGKG
jgi:hypothetical protein